MSAQSPNAFDYVFRIDTELTEDDTPEWLELGEFIQVIDYKTFVFRVRGVTRKLFGREVSVQMIHADPWARWIARPPAARRLEAAARCCALFYLLAAKKVRAKPLYYNACLKLVVALRVDDQNLADILREKGFTD